MVINGHGTIIGRRERNKANIRQRLQETGWQMFRTFGYEATSVQQIADAADTAKATFFNYYPTKDHLLAEFHVTSVQSILAAHQERMYESASDALLQLTRALLQWPEREPQLTAAIVRNLWGSAVMAEHDRVVGDAFSSLLEAIMQRGVDEREFRADVNPPLAVSLIASVLNGCVLDWVMTGCQFKLSTTGRKRMTLLMKAFT